MKKIFIADDDLRILESLKELLKLSGYEVDGTRNPKEVMAKIKTFHPQLILLDLLMPNLGGFEICDMLNKDQETQGIPIIIISALGREEDIKMAYKLGVIGYFTKPFDFQLLLKEISRAIESKDSLIE